MKKPNLLKSAIALAAALPLCAMAGGHKAFVSNELDSGPGSLRAALASGASKIVIKPTVETITIQSSLVYSSHAPLRIIGSGQLVTGDTGTAPLFEVSNGADLLIRNLDFAGPGGYSIENQGGGKGIFVKVPADAEDMVSVKLVNVTVSDTGYHGVHISDCTSGDDCGAGQSGGEEPGSKASISLQLRGVLIENAGTGRQDGDGIRVDDRDEGDILFKATNSALVNVGGDGIELDEGAEGSVIVSLRNASFVDNGHYCSADFVADPIALDPACNDDGDPDVDDAFDIDEAGEGGIEGTIANIELINNFDEGLDFDSEGAGEDNFIDLDIVNVFARDNDDEAIKVSEEQDASVHVRMRALDIGGDVEVEEEGDGDMAVVIRGSVIGDDLKLSEEGAGVGTVKLRGTTVADEKDFNNISEI